MSRYHIALMNVAQGHIYKISELQRLVNNERALCLTIHKIVKIGR